MDEILQKFLAKAPVAVMIRATLVRVLAGPALDGPPERITQVQYN